MQHPIMEESKTYYNFDINGNEYLFDDEKSYKYDLFIGETISDLHLLHFTFPDTEFSILISSTNKGFIDFGSSPEFTSFLKERGVDYRLYECTKYKQEKAPDRIKITLKSGSTHLLAMMHPHFFRLVTIFEYQVPKLRLNFKKTMAKKVILMWTGEDLDGEQPKPFLNYIKKQRSKEHIFILKFLAIVAFIIWFFIYIL